VDGAFPHLSTTSLDEIPQNRPGRRGAPGSEQLSGSTCPGRQMRSTAPWKKNGELTKQNVGFSPGKMGIFTTKNGDVTIEKSGIGGKNPGISPLKTEFLGRLKT